MTIRIMRRQVTSIPSFLLDRSGLERERSRAENADGLSIGVCLAAGIFVSTVALTLSQAPFGIAILAPIALVPWLLAVSRISASMAVLSGVILGTAYVCVSAHWLVPAFASQGVVGFRALLATALTGVWAEGLLFGGIGWVAQRVKNRGAAEQALILAAVIAAGEYWAAHSHLGLPLLLLGHSQHLSPGVMQLAVATGVPGLSALLLAMNSAVASLFYRRGGAGCLAVGLFAGWFGLILFGECAVETVRSKSTSEPLNILVVQPDFDRSQRWDPAFQRSLLADIGEYTAGVVKSSADVIDLVVWPENLLTQPFNAQNRLESRLDELVNSWNVPLVVGLTRVPHRLNSDTHGTPEFLNSSVWWSPQRGITDSVEKVVGVPFIESNRDFVGREFLGTLLGLPEGHRRVAEASEASWLADQFVVTPTLCFEILFPDEVAQRRHPDSVAILNLADDSWVDGEVVDRQIFAASAFRAVEQRLPLVRVGHGGLSGVINSMGRQESMLPPDQFAHFTTRVAATSPASNREKAVVVSIPILIGGVATLCMHAFSSRHSRRE